MPTAVQGTCGNLLNAQTAQVQVDKIRHLTQCIPVGLVYGTFIDSQLVNLGIGSYVGQDVSYNNVAQFSAAAFSGMYSTESILCVPVIRYDTLSFNTFGFYIVAEGLGGNVNLQVVVVLVARKGCCRGRNKAGKMNGLVIPCVKDAFTQYLNVLGNSNLLHVAVGVECVVAYPAQGLREVNLLGDILLVSCIARCRNYEVFFIVYGHRLRNIQFLGEGVVAVGIHPFGKAQGFVQLEAEVHIVYCYVFLCGKVPCAHVGFHCSFHGITHLCFHNTAGC